MLRRSKCSPRGIYVMEIWIEVFVQREQTYGDQSVRLAGYGLWRSPSKTSSSGVVKRRS